ncbi:hypothetical protein [Variovorax sp. V15]|uniref:hypothetical protein n=1 Tax=Variovorax sp. V15 TaxID=3065952 RepID=UPI0034E8DE4D
MALQLLRLNAYPGRIAATKTGSVVPDGAFFLDFARPLKALRAFGIGPVTGFLVPVIHQGESRGGFVISVSRSEPYFVDLKPLWAHHQPGHKVAAAGNADNLAIVADFAAQFPEDCR